MWFNKIIEAYKQTQAHTFVLHGPGVDDSIAPGVMLGAYLRRQLVKLAFDIVLFYDPSTGISFPDDLAAALHREKVEKGEAQASDYESMRIKAARLMGLIADTSSTAKRPGSPLNRAVSEQQQVPQMPNDPLKALALIDAMLYAQSTAKKPPRIAVIFEFASVTFSRSQTASPDFDTRAIFAQKWAMDADWISGRGSPLILYIAREKEALHQDVARSRMFSIELLAPDFDERLAFIEMLLENYNVKYDKGMNSRLLAVHTAGLSRLQIEDILANCQFADIALGTDVVVEAKRRAMKDVYGGLLEVVTPRWGFERVEGHDEAKEYLLSNVVAPLRSGNIRRAPKGIIFTGPPGTGKTTLAEALAYEAGINFAKLSVQSLMDKYVGNSERNLRNALNAVRSLTPCIVFLDEFDNSFSSRDSGDTNQVNKNLLGMILEFASEPANRGKVVLLAATNRPDKIDPALRRVGRFDKMIPLLPPDADTRAAIMQVVARSINAKWTDDVDFEAAKQLTEGWTQAEIEGLVRAAYAEADDNNHGDILTQDDLDNALTYTSPSTAQVEAWSSLAVSMCTDKRLLPAAWRAMLEQDALPELPSWTENETYSGRRSREL